MAKKKNFVMPNTGVSMKTNTRETLMTKILGEVVEMKTMCFTDFSIKEYLCNKYGYSAQDAATVISIAQSRLDIATEKALNDVARKNAMRLERLINKTFEKEQYARTIDAIDKLNKTAGIYLNRVEVFSGEPIKLNFDGDKAELAQAQDVTDEQALPADVDTENWEIPLPPVKEEAHGN